MLNTDVLTTDVLIEEDLVHGSFLFIEIVQ